MLQKLRDALKEAMKNKNIVAKSVIQGIISSADESRIKLKRELTDAELIDVIRKENKMYAEALSGAEAANREDLIAEAKAKIEITNQFLPAQPTKEELMILAHAAIIAKKIDVSNKGLMMKELMPILKEVTDGKTASEIINSLIQ